MNLGELGILDFESCVLGLRYSRPETYENQNTVKAWLQLARVSNLPTAISNILVAYLIAHGGWFGSIDLFLLLLASSSFYIAGMVLNDVFDVEQDTQERPGRPIPSGQIGFWTAAYAGCFLIAIGLVCASAAGFSSTQGVPLGDLPWLQRPVLRCTLIATMLLVCIVLYDGPCKKTIFAPILMGGCRCLNLLLGASTFVPDVGTANIDPILGLPLAIWWLAASIGVLISGVTLLARNEASRDQQQAPLIWAAIVIVFGALGLALLFVCPECLASASSQINGSETSDDLFPRGQERITSAAVRGYVLFLICVLCVSLRHLISAIRMPSPKSVQRSVIAILRSLIMLDAAVAFLYCDGQLIYPLVIASLMIPSVVLGKFIRST